LTILIVSQGKTVPYEREKRQRPRVKVTWPVIVQTDQGNIKGETLNITVDGALILCHEPLEPEERVDIALHVPSLVRPLNIPARVIHCSGGDEPTSYEIGIRFTDISEKSSWLISTAVQRESGVMLMP
jgi:hypothetical protein